MASAPSSLLIYRRDKPRTFAISNKDWILSFQSDKTNKYRSITEFVPANDFDVSSFRVQRTLPVYGCLGLIALQDHVFLGIVTGCSQVAKLRQGESVQRIHAVEFYCLDNPMYDTKAIDINGAAVPLGEEDIYETTQRPSDYEHPCIEIQRLLEGGTFYFSTDHDLSLNMQTRGRENYDPEDRDHQFLWNSYMIASMEIMRSNMSDRQKAALDHGRFFTSIIRGFAETISVTVGSSMPGQLTLISRLSSLRAGTRYNARGIDDDGNVANFVETETILNTNLWTSSFCQVRGSVPLFWEQVTSNFMSHKVEVTRSPTATQAAFEKHFSKLLDKYGHNIHVVNLLGQSSGETLLSSLYKSAIQSSSPDMSENIHSTNFDFHAQVKGGYDGAVKIRSHILADSTAYRYYRTSTTGKLLHDTIVQKGVFRTNCLDCLDRTNMIQNILSQVSLENVLLELGIHPMSVLWERHSTLWADNGDALSRIYAGTNALKTSFTRKGKMSLAGAISDATKSVGRMYINNFQDKGRQLTIDTMLGRIINQKNVTLFDPIADWVNSRTLERKSEWSTSKKLSIFAGTYNLNGRTGAESLEDWLFPSGKVEADIYAIGFQEIVELTPSQIVSADPVKVRYWADKCLQTLDPKENDKYVLLRTGQLVGTALLIFVRVECLGHLKLVEGATKKTGLKGMSGNKGAVAIRMEYGATRICFVNSHFAAGHGNYSERNQDFNTIAGGLHFQRGRTIMDHHDAIIWLGDFNYRINTSMDEVKGLIEAQDWGSLYRDDQLNRQMVEGRVFKYFNEKQISFPPTYKFDNGTDDYDSSDKQRIPAWTDRILKCGSGLKQILYDSAPSLRFSDHKPVYATYELEVFLVDEPKKTSIEKALYEERKALVGESGINDDTNDYEVDLLDGDRLPPPSSDQSRWWLEAHDTSKSSLKNPPGMRLNPARNYNPYEHSTEPDFIKVYKDRSQKAPPPILAKKPSLARKPIIPATEVFRDNPPPLPSRSTDPKDTTSENKPPPLPSRSSTVKSLTPSTQSVGSSAYAKQSSVPERERPLPPLARNMQAISSPAQVSLKDQELGPTDTLSGTTSEVLKEDHLEDNNGTSNGDNLSNWKSLM